MTIPQKGKGRILGREDGLGSPQDCYPGGYFSCLLCASRSGDTNLVGNRDVKQEN